jgi:hypothetical protein
MKRIVPAPLLVSLGLLSVASLARDARASTTATLCCGAGGCSWSSSPGHAVASDDCPVPPSMGWEIALTSVSAVGGGSPVTVSTAPFHGFCTMLNAVRGTASRPDTCVAVSPTGGLTGGARGASVALDMGLNGTAKYFESCYVPATPGQCSASVDLGGYCCTVANTLSPRLSIVNGAQVSELYGYSTFLADVSPLPRLGWLDGHAGPMESATAWAAARDLSRWGEPGDVSWWISPVKTRFAARL